LLVIVLNVLYLSASIWLSVYGFNAIWLIWLYVTRRTPSAACSPTASYPTVTVQLPTYNERYVVSHAIEALAHLDWPRSQLQIQVVDDSTDDTVEIVRAQVDKWQSRGLNIAHVHRCDRTGYKAGALNEALPEANGDYVALFDADFCPPPDFLVRTVPHLVSDPQLAFVQARWGHLNALASSLTRAQAIALDGHFVIEHVARERGGLLTSFNGTAGVWRREAIEELGGWDPGQLTEDVDLAYRAQLAGWRGKTLPDLAAPAELPAQMTWLRRQQSRWAKGNTQCLLKLGRAVARAPLSWGARLQALIHLSYYLAHPLMLLVLLLSLPLVWQGALEGWSLAALSAGTAGPPILFALGQAALHRRWWCRLRALPALVCIGFGMALNSTVAIAQVLLGAQSTFLRTPKMRAVAATGRTSARSYALAPSPLVWGELALAAYALLTAAVAAYRGVLGAIPFQLLYAFGFSYVSLTELVQARRRGREWARGIESALS
jgi:cellulose synthase/poly-beta-1,6-N-acetylglucosamine synthase-like glycosyltransferase